MSERDAAPADRIAAAEAFHLGIPSVYGGPPPRGPAQWPIIELVLIRVVAADGLTGWGEAFGHRACAATKAAFDTLVAPLAVGADTADIAATGETLRRALFTYGLNGPVGFALAGLDIALWDLRGQRAGTPVHKLIAESSAGTVPAYASLLRYGDADVVAAAAADAVTRGHRAVKLHEAEVAAVEAARAAVGGDVRLSLDVNCRWSLETALASARQLEPLGLDWIEEPAWPTDADTFARIAAATRTPLAGGENAGSLSALDGLAARGRVRYLQPSAAKLGGLSGLLAARHIAQARGVGLAPHSAYFGPGLAATGHFCAAFGLACEWYDCRLETSPSGLLPRDGALELSPEPGLGVSVTGDLLQRYRIAA